MPEREIVGYLVNGQRHGVVDDSAPDVADDQDRQPTSVAYQVWRHDLGADHGENGVLEALIRTHELAHLRVFGCRRWHGLIVEITV